MNFENFSSFAAWPKGSVDLFGKNIAVEEKMSTLIAALKLDEHPLVNQFMYIEEQGNACGSFILSAIIQFQIENNHNVILLTCQNSLGHFQALSKKLGYDLMSLKESGRVYIIDILDKITNENFLLSKEPFKELHCEIKKQVDSWGCEKSVCIIVENLGNLVLAGIEDCFTFINHLRRIAFKQKNSSFVLSVHNFPNSANILEKSIRHVADVIVVLKDLQTGKANDVTGHLTVIRRTENYKKNISEYHYQLQDRSVNVFTPGSKILM